MLRKFLSLLTLNRCVIATALVLIVVVNLAPKPGARSQPDHDFRLVGPQGEPIVVQLPELMKIRPLDVADACDSILSHNANARGNAAAAPGAGWEYSIYRAAEAGCADPDARTYPFYEDIVTFYRVARDLSRDDMQQFLAAMRDALRAATAPKDVAGMLTILWANAPGFAEPLHAPDLFLVGAKAMELRVRYCEGDDAATCRREAHMKRGQSLFDAGRWRADADLLRAGIAAYREALSQTEVNSSEWVELRTLIGSSLGQLSERFEGEARRPLLRAALDEYELARSAADPSDHSTWAMINQNVCSIRQPLAGLDRDRANTRLAIEECDKARAYYAESKEKTNEAAAHYNAARAEERLAEWDRDEAAAMRAVEHVRRTVQLYEEDDAMLSRAFGQVHLAEALLLANDFVKGRNHGEGKEQSRALLTEARQSLDDAEPILRRAQARGYLERHTAARRQLDRAQPRG